jgi:hypothetical protein
MFWLVELQFVEIATFIYFRTIFKFKIIAITPTLYIIFQIPI